MTCKSKNSKCSKKHPRRRNSAKSAAGTSAKLRRALLAIGAKKTANDQAALLAEKWERIKAEARKLFEEASKIEFELAKTLGVGGEVKLADGRTAKIEDQFLEKDGTPKNVAFKQCGVSRFVLKIK